MRYRLHMCIRHFPTLPLFSGLRAGGREEASGGKDRRPPTRLCKKTPRRLHAHLRRGVPGHESPSRIQPAEFASHTTHAPARLRHGFGLRNCTHAVRRSSFDLKTPPLWTIGSWLQHKDVANIPQITSSSDDIQTTTHQGPRAPGRGGHAKQNMLDMHAHVCLFPFLFSMRLSKATLGKERRMKLTPGEAIRGSATTIPPGEAKRGSATSHTPLYTTQPTTSARAAGPCPIQIKGQRGQPYPILGRLQTK